MERYMGCGKEGMPLGCACRAMTSKHANVFDWIRVLISNMCVDFKHARPNQSETCDVCCMLDLPTVYQYCLMCEVVQTKASRVWAALIAKRVRLADAKHAMLNAKHAMLHKC